MKILFAFSIAVLASGCQTTKPLQLNEIVAQQEQECSATNGNLQRVGNFIYACAWPTSDAGKTCNDSSNCDGICELPESAFDVGSSTTKLADGSMSQPIKILLVRIGDELQGVCSSTRFAGKSTNCTLFISQGKVTSTKCIE